MKLVSPYDRRHPVGVVAVRIAVGIWLLCLAAFACWNGWWWGAVLVAPALLHFYLAYRVRHDTHG